MFNGIKSFWRGLVGNTQRNTSYLPVSGRRFSPLPTYDDPTYVTCIEILTKAMGNVKYRVYSDDFSEKDFKPFRKVFGVKANSTMNTAEFFRLMEYERLVKGNAYAYIKWGKDGSLDELIPLDASKMHVYYNDTKEIIYTDIIYEYNDGKNLYTFLPEELIHVKAYSQDGIKGRPAAEVLASVLQQAGLANSYLEEIMNNGYGGVMTLEYLSELNKERAKELMSQIKELLKHQGNRMLALPPGVKAALIGPTGVDTAFIDMTDKVSRKISGFFGVPLFMLNQADGNGTASMTSAQATSFYQNVVQPVVNQYTAEFSSKLLTSYQIRQGVHFDCADLAGFSILNASEKVDNYVKLAAGGILTCNEIRKEIGYKPYKDEMNSGDMIYRNGAFTTGNGDNGDSVGSKEEDITKRDNTQKPN